MNRVASIIASRGLDFKLKEGLSAETSGKTYTPSLHLILQCQGLCSLHYIMLFSREWLNLGTVIYYKWKIILGPIDSSILAPMYYV
jgi:hypothetical protein